ncbi:ATP-binding cassette domain-containing protein [Oceanobacillus sp. 143]|uniref:High-affinity branched-chain amino acid ABC transporter ATP-binding protein LivG n=1 Tax=Oceanobacillus zhaokaii TaxID=2052660 RepID=A0A345PJN7_9BACI|nr:ABC transporter ATP-binding protein [Oceanobacillus zhaokaii]AXI10217.1 high-affinity branched-chain amino acid ABC transporter ATP-binding protein LivG [Oceanobacillus zhaokaii]QGS69307.1 ATP-binding cassette domain-containing protein [Oceanobacillus sp. 143]
MILKVENLTKSFGGLRAVNEVNFEVKKGDIHAIIGPNGAGKSTFFNLISGFHRPTSGTIMFKGEDITKMPANKIAKLGIARTFQTTNLFEDETVLDNLIIGNRLRTKSGLFDAILRTKREKREEMESIQKAYDALEFMEISDLSDERIGNITQEQKKRVAFALALTTDPELVLLDEPAAGVNPGETDGLSTLIKKMAESGLTVCLIEHKMSMIMSLADRIVVLNQGARIAEGTPKEIQNNPVVIEAYLGSEEDEPVKV